MHRLADAPDGAGFYGCSAAARWLPRILGGCLLAAAVVVSLGVDPESVVTGSRGFRTGVIVLAAVFALWIVRRGGELRLRIELRERELWFVSGAHQARLRLADVRALRYEAPFGASRSWLPATVLADRTGRDWRLPGLLTEGDRLIDEIVERSGEAGVAAWADALHLRERMRRSAARVRLGYAVSAAMLLFGLLYHLGAS